MAYSSVNAMLNVSRQNNQPLWDVILQSDLLESGLTRPQSLAEMHHLWQVMVQTSDNYCGADRSASGFAGGDAAKVAEAEARAREHRTPSQRPDRGRPGTAVSFFRAIYETGGTHYGKDDHHFGP